MFYFEVLCDVFAMQLYNYQIAGTVFTSNYSITSNYAFYDELEEVVFNFIVTLVPRPLWGKEPGAGVML